jgi:hypothetical protein
MSVEVLDLSYERTPNAASGVSEEVSGRPEDGSRLRKVGEAVAVVSASALAGGGAGMLAGVALGAINPYALGLFGTAVGIITPVLLKIAVGAWGPRRRRWLGG